jgi:hypothetical protein
MSTKAAILIALLAGMAGLAPCVAAQGIAGQSFAGSASSGPMEPSGVAGNPVGPAADPAAPEAADSNRFAQGTRAINEGHWAAAVAIFEEVAAQHGEHADGATYWEAYAQNKQGQPSLALKTCADLGHKFPGSGWIHECGALEIEIRARSGKPIAPRPGDDDDLKLLALNALMLKDEPRALAEIQQILNGEASEHLKKEAMFILGQHYSNATYAQIVRLSYVEGDVRIERGQSNENANGDDWEKATANLPLETGFSLVTGAGRAEIELEDASTFYLGENSVLLFNDLHTTAGVPFTEVALLTGTASLYVRPYVPGEVFIMRTPTDTFVSRYPNTSYARLGSYTDATTITPLEGGTLHLNGVPKEVLARGRTLRFHEARPLDQTGYDDSASFGAWDKWVASRVAQRTAAISEVMRASGLSAPIPGMAEMKGQGTFFECAPYGTCWEPSGAESAGPADSRDDEAQTAVAQAGATQSPTSGQAPNSNQAQPRQASSGGALELNSLAASFPCLPAALRFRTEKDPKTGKVRIVDLAPASLTIQYDWAVCHAGSWIHRRHHYVWVAGHKRHHLEPVRWVKGGHTVGFVPLHPYDVKDQPPLNRKEKVFAPIVGKGRSEIAIAEVHFEADRPITYLKEPPKEFRDMPMQPLAHVETPHMEVHHFEIGLGNKGEIAKAGIPLSFDHKQQSFTMPTQVVHAGHAVTVNAPVSNRGGNLQSRGGSFAGSSGGGGSHGGGGSTGSGGGGSTGSNTSSSSSSAASSSSSSTSTTSSTASTSVASPSSGSHH